MTEPAWNTEELRALVREALVDLLPHGATSGDSYVRGGTITQETTSSPIPESHENTAAMAPETITIRNDADLANFALRLLHLFENPKHREDLRMGRLSFHLAAAPHAENSSPVRRIEKGAVTEAMVKDAARVGAHLLLGRNAVLTPLARDRARSDGVIIERESR